VVCSVLVVVLSAAYAFSRFVVDQKIADAVLLKNGSTTEKEWEHPTVPLYNKYYFLDVTNAYEVQTMGAKPSFTERGPYVYREYRLKENVEWSENEEIVSYLPIDYFIFDRNMSVGDPMEDQVTTINYILMSALNFLNGTALQKDPDIEKLVALILSLLQGESLLITRSVHDFLWGYEDSILKIVSKFMDNIPSKFPLQNNVTTANPQAISRIRTGVNNLDGLGQFVVWNNMTYLPYWNGSKAQELKGTEGFFFKPGVGKEPLYVFVDFLFRSGYFSYSQNERVKGIDVYRFAIPKVEMGNTSIDPANAGYYSYGPSGLFNMSSCYPMNPPIFLSKPHFLDCSSSVLEAVEGLQPVRALHDSFLDVEPMTGILFSGVKRIQTNIHVQRDKNIWQLETVPTLYFPIFWVEEVSHV
jgi:lysosome membrane protein 2